MIKKLRQKFITIAMLSISIVLLIIIGTINITNFISVNNSLNVRLELISDNGGTFPDLMNYSPHPDDAPPAPDNSEEKSFAPHPDRNDIFDKPGINKESQFATRYFTVTLNQDGSVVEINTGKISAISSDEASDLATELYSKNKTIGYIDNYKFLRTDYSSDNEASDINAENINNQNINSNNKIMYVFVNCQQEIETVKYFLFASVGISIVGLLGVFILVWYFSGIIVRPVAESYEKQKRFITDASHEIKTPLTIIDANTEVIEMMEGENEWTQSIRKQIKRLASLTEKLVFLSRMDEESTRLDFTDFSLSDALLDTADSFKTVAETKHKDLSVNIEENISYHGDEKNIRQLISLLLDNAMKYSSENGSIRLSLKASGKSKIISVWNTVDEISVGNHDELFERFLRLDKSRNSKTGGFGIGLSVAYAIVNAHKGKITAHSDDGKSLIFTITL